MTRRAFILLILMLWVWVPTWVYSMELALIVHRDNRIDQVSSRNLSRIFKQEKKHWPDNQKIYLIMQEDGTVEKALFVKKIYKMRPNELKRFWLAKILNGETQAFPKTLSSSDAIKRFVSQIPSAVAYIDANLVDETVKVVKVDGKKPGDEGYFLAGR